jgi:CheY-like chemotaxis protein
MPHLITLSRLFSQATTIPNALAVGEIDDVRRCMSAGLVTLADVRPGMRSNGRTAAARPMSLVLTQAGRDAVAASSPPCYACGKPVIGHVPSADGRPCCSLACASACEHCGGHRRLIPGGGHKLGCVDYPITLTNGPPDDDTIGSRISAGSHGFGPPMPLLRTVAEREQIARDLGYASLADLNDAPDPIVADVAVPAVDGISLLERMRAFCTAADLVADGAPDTWPTQVLQHMHSENPCGLARLMLDFADADGEIIDGDAIVEALNVLGLHKVSGTATTEPAPPAPEPAPPEPAPPALTRSQKKNAKRDAARAEARAERQRIAQVRTDRNARGAT